MIAPLEVERRRLVRLESPGKIAWLRERVRAYVIEHAARSYFKLPPFPDMEERTHKDEAMAACIGTAESHGITDDIAQAAFRAEWDAAMKLAVRAGEKLKIAALSHIKIAGSTEGICASLQAARDKIAADGAYLTDTELAAIAAGFKPASKARRVA